MRILVVFTGPLRAAAPGLISVPEGTSLAALCRRLAEESGGDIRRQLLAADGGLEPTLLVAVNGVGVAAPDRPRRVLADGDEVLFMPPIAGG